MIESDNNTRLHSDALRLFLNRSSPSPNSESWSYTDTNTSDKYTSSHKARKHATRDGLAFATITLPPQFSVLFSIFSHIKWRMEEGFKIKRVYEWGGALGSGLWAGLCAFPSQGKRAHQDFSQRGRSGDGEVDEEGERGYRVRESSLKLYRMYDKNEGLTRMGQRLLSGEFSNSFQLHSIPRLCYQILTNPSFISDIELPDHTQTQYYKSYHPSHRIPSFEQRGSMAVTAFALSSFRDPVSRKERIREIWDSGSEFIVSRFFTLSSVFSNFAGVVGRVVLDLMDRC